MEHNEFGREGEEVATAFLLKKGLKIVERNWRHRKFEVDIIAEDQQDLVFVEVKTRRVDLHGDPYLSVGKTKQRNLIQAADAYAEKYEVDRNIRFDIISIILQKSPEIEHIEEAFYP